MLIEIKVPDVGDFKNIPVIEVLVHLGEDIESETPLITLETEKAMMEVPSPHSGRVKEIKVKVGDKVSAGSVILTIESTVESASSHPKNKKNTDKLVQTEEYSASVNSIDSKSDFHNCTIDDVILNLTQSAERIKFVLPNGGINNVVLCDLEVGK